MFDVSKVTHESRILIGAVKVNKPFVYHDASYECAAWWEDREACEGVHPVYLSRAYHSPKLLTITAHIKAKVVDDYFPGLWCGNLISREPYKPKHIGEERTIYQGIEVVDAIERTGNSPGSDLDWFIHPSWWKVFTDEALAELNEDYRRLPEFWDAWDKLDPSTFHTKMDGRWKFDDEYRSKIGMVAYFGNLLEKWARRIEKINWRAQYHKPGSSYDTEYQRNNFASNTEWAKAIPIQVHE
jgi:hypothetical protein